MANIVFKDNSFGRPRPIQTIDFGGDHAYTPVFHYSGQCQKNCSFVSGHASIAFSLIALAWACRRRSLLALGVTLGIAAGFGRMVQGAHYLSDVVFAFWVVYFVCVICAHLFNLQIRRPTESPS